MRLGSLGLTVGCPRGGWNRADTDGGGEKVGSSVQSLVDGWGECVWWWEWGGHCTDWRKHTGSSKGITIQTRVKTLVSSHRAPLGTRSRIDKSRRLELLRESLLGRELVRWESRLVSKGLLRELLHWHSRVGVKSRIRTKLLSNSEISEGLELGRDTLLSSHILVFGNAWRRWSRCRDERTDRIAGRQFELAKRVEIRFRISSDGQGILKV